MQGRANQFARDLLGLNAGQIMRLPCNNSDANHVANQTWLRTHINQHLAAIGAGPGGANRVRLFMLYLRLALRERGYDVTGPDARQIRFWCYDNAIHQPGDPASPSLAIEASAVVANPGSDAQPPAGAGTDMLRNARAQEIAALLNGNWRNHRSDTNAAGVAGQFLRYYQDEQHGGTEFLDELNRRLEASGRSVAWDSHLQRLILYNALVANQTRANRQARIDLFVGETDTVLITARQLEEFFDNPRRSGGLLTLRQLGALWRDRRALFPVTNGGPGQFDIDLNAILSHYQIAVTFTPSPDGRTDRISLHRLGPDGRPIEPAAHTEVLEAQVGGDILQQQREQHAREFAAQLTAHWANGNNDTNLATQFQNYYENDGGAEFVAALNRVLEPQNHAVRHENRRLILLNIQGNRRTEQRRINLDREFARNLAAQLNANWTNSNHDAEIARLFQQGFDSLGGTEFVDLLNQELRARNRSVRYDEVAWQLALFDGTDQNNRQLVRRIDLPRGSWWPTWLDPCWCTGVGISLLPGIVLAVWIRRRIQQMRTNRNNRRAALLESQNRLRRAQRELQESHQLPPMQDHPAQGGTDHPTTGQPPTQTHVDATDPTARQLTDLVGDTPEERQAVLDGRLDEVRRRHLNNWFLNSDVLRTFQAQAEQFLRRLSDAQRAGNLSSTDRANMFRDFIRDFVLNNSGNNLSGDHRTLFQNMQIVEHDFIGTGTVHANHTVVHGPNGTALHIGLPTGLLSAPMSDFQIRHVLGSLFDQCFRAERLVRRNPGNVQVVRTDGNVLADFVVHSMNHALHLGVDAHTARIQFNSSRATSYVTHISIEFHGDTMVIRRIGGQPMTEEEARAEELRIHLDEISRLQRWLDDPANANHQRRQNVQERLRTLREQHAHVTGANAEARVRARAEIRARIREHHRRAAGRTGATHVPAAMLADEGLALLLGL
jgi:hypothetical protein